MTKKGASTEVEEGKKREKCEIRELRLNRRLATEDAMRMVLARRPTNCSSKGLLVVLNLEIEDGKVNDRSAKPLSNAPPLDTVPRVLHLISPHIFRRQGSPCRQGKQVEVEEAREKEGLVGGRWEERRSSSGEQQ